MCQVLCFQIFHLLYPLFTFYPSFWSSCPPISACPQTHLLSLSLCLARFFTQTHTVWGSREGRTNHSHCPIVLWKHRGRETQPDRWERERGRSVAVLKPSPSLPPHAQWRSRRATATQTHSPLSHMHTHTHTYHTHTHTHTTTADVAAAPCPTTYTNTHTYTLTVTAARLSGKKAVRERERESWRRKRGIAEGREEKKRESCRRHLFGSGRIFLLSERLDKSICFFVEQKDFLTRAVSHLLILPTGFLRYLPIHLQSSTKEGGRKRESEK